MGEVRQQYHTSHHQPLRGPSWDVIQGLCKATNQSGDKVDYKCLNMPYGIEKKFLSMILSISFSDGIIINSGCARKNGNRCFKGTPYLESGFLKQSFVSTIKLMLPAGILSLYETFFCEFIRLRAQSLTGPKRFQVLLAWVGRSVCELHFVSGSKAHWEWHRPRSWGPV